jgi:hypothetical protein
MPTREPEPVPWDYHEAGGVRIWDWAPEHFRVRILADDAEKRTYRWLISDITSGFTRTFEQGVDYSFRDAENSVLEVIAKGYPESFGYRRYAGALATTFQVRDGSRFDFGPLESRSVIVTYLDDKDQPENAVGRLSIHHWELRVRLDATTVLQIPPHRLVDIQLEDARQSLILEPNSQSKPVATPKVANREIPKAPGFFER